MVQKLRAGAPLVAAALFCSLPLTAGRADGSVTIDLRTTTGSKTVNNAKAGDVVTLNVYALIRGGDAVANDGIQSILGSFASVPSSGSAPTGNFSADGTNGSWTPAAVFNNGGAYQPGKLQDLNGMAGLDLGSTVTSGDPSATDYVQARSPSMTVATTAGTTSSPAELLLGQVQFKLLTAGTGGQTSLNFYPLVAAGGLNVGSGTYDANAIIWREDGLSKRPTNGTVDLGTPVSVVAVPEPASAGLVGLAAVGLLARRRRGA